jgi:hypothetical protein
MILRSLFRNLSLFPPCYLYRFIPLLRSLVCSHSILPIHFLQSIPSVSSLLHFPPCLWIFFHILPLLFPISCTSFSYSLYFFIASSTRLLVVFITLLYIVIIGYMKFSFHASFFFSLFLSLFFNPQFHPCYYCPGSSFPFLFSFCPLTYPFVSFR